MAACSEEDRRAWVSILPISQDEEPEEAAAPGPLGVTPDSSAVVAGRDTVFSVMRVPEEAGGREARIAGAAVSPDSTAIAMRLEGPAPAVLVWSRSKQTAFVAGTYPGGEALTVDWSPGGRLLAFGGREAGGRWTGGIFDAEVGLVGRQAVQRWLERQGQSIRFQSWVAPGRARFLVGPEEGGLAYVWDVPSGTFILEAHMEPLAANAPPGSPQRAGVFSLDLAGDPVPETVALFRGADGAPGALVLLDAGPGGVRGALTTPLLPYQALGLSGWKDASLGAELYQIAEVGGRTTLLLALPSRSSYAAIGFFQVIPAGALEPLPMLTPSGLAPAILPEGTVGEETKQIGVVDLDGDGRNEVVTATGRREGSAIRWSADVFRWDGTRLTLAPELSQAAVERIERLTEGR